MGLVLCFLTCECAVVSDILEGMSAGREEWGFSCLAFHHTDLVHDKELLVWKPFQLYLTLRWIGRNRLIKTDLPVWTVWWAFLEHYPDSCRPRSREVFSFLAFRYGRGRLFSGSTFVWGMIWHCDWFISFSHFDECRSLRFYASVTSTGQLAPANARC